MPTTQALPQMTPYTLKPQLALATERAILKAAPALGTFTQQWPLTASGQLSEESIQAVRDGIRVERPKNPEHGDLAVNISFLARWTKMAPPQMAQVIADHWPEGDIPKPTVVAGFLNVALSPALFAKSIIGNLSEPETLGARGKNQALKNDVILLEYVSANPTGPLHIGHGRWAALGDSLRRVFEHCGAHVTAEFYVNDAGVQMNNLAYSMWYRCLEVLGLGGLPKPVEGEPYPFYPGEYLLASAQDFLATAANKTQVEAGFNVQKSPSESLLNALKAFGKETMLAEQKRLLNQLGVRFDVWTFETDIHQSGQVKQAIDTLKTNGHTYEQEGALWLKTEALGDEKDRVLIKSDGSYTYLSPDIAYHLEKYTRQNPQHNRFMNIWGADHHGYIARMKAAIQALGLNPDQLEILLGQLVNLIEDGEKMRMGKRRKMLTLSDVVDGVGVDATRFWMVMRAAETTIDFDVELAASATQENPVFYAQYAHARCASILRRATEATVNPETGETVTAPLTPEALAHVQKTLTPETLVQHLFNPLQQDAAVLTPLKTILMRLDGFEEAVVQAAKTSSSHSIARYALDLAAEFHSLYTVCRMVTEDTDQTLARLMVVSLVQLTLAQSLALLGVSAPDRM